MDEQKEILFWEHVEELRKHIIHCFYAIAISTVILMNNKKIIFDYILFGPAKKDFITYRFLSFLTNKIGLVIKPVFYLSNNLEIQNRKIFGQFNTYIWFCFIGGLIVSSPYIFYEFWRFIKPALSDKEKKYSKGMIISLSALFFSGIFFGYFILFPFLIHFGFSFKISHFPKNIFDLSDYISLMIHSVLSMGFLFLFPFFIFFFTKIGIISPIFLKKYRRYAFFIMLIISSAITPGDILSTIIVMIPLIFLYQVSIYISYLFMKQE